MTAVLSINVPSKLPVESTYINPLSMVLNAFNAALVNGVPSDKIPLADILLRKQI